MLVGARQTGKTYPLQEFCNKNFERQVYLNFADSRTTRLQARLSLSC
ncbi:MAG: AAA family ATPase [Tannerella sp.]|nr:AAA family ATPase [Tannerella sp.]